MIDQKLIDEINELARIKKQRPLTQKEEERQAELRKEYLRQFREGFRQTLENIEIVDEKKENA